MQSLGWNRAENDHVTHWHSSRGNYIVLTHKDPSSSSSAEEKAVGIVLPITYPNKTGWIGFFVVDEAYRGTGGGGRLFQAALDEFARQGTERVGLDGVLEQMGTALLLRVMQEIKSFDGSVVAEKSLVAEVWGENPVAVETFEELGWEYTGMDYSRMWLDGKETEAQKKGGLAEKEVFAWFDAGEG
ncbi:hypothetical protein UCDDS831_g05400 [Diplodia seriata]|uniref:N-acetyltransferase domain-containing protein n=1 Tax=Diplodia seriata TaxID=420778 RepID=A0A0G2GRK2_9PEZI|nr:hypothetical protein UCDDS831_g05400 [Diplodia seriata]